VVSDGPDDYPLVSALDYLIILDQVAVNESQGKIRDNAIVITDKRTVEDPPKGDYRWYELPVSETAIKLGNRRIANTIALGALAALGGLVERDTLEEFVVKRSPKAFVDLNRDAFAAGWDMAGTV